MVTVGRGLLQGAAFEFFEGLRTFDAKRAAAVLADNVQFQSPWSGPLASKAAVQAFLQQWLTDAVKRPSFTIRDVSGDGAVTRLELSVSGRFGKAPEHLGLNLLCLRGVVHQVAFVPSGAGAPVAH